MNDNSRDTDDNLSSQAVNPDKLDWRIPLAKDLAKFCKAEGLSPTTNDFHLRVLHLFYQLAELDAGRPKDQQVGYAKARAKYKDPKAQTQIVTLVRKHWPTIDGAIHVQLPQMQKNPFDSLTEAAAPSPKLFKMRYDEPFRGVLSLTLDGDYALDGLQNTVSDFLRGKFPEAEVVVVDASLVKRRVVDIAIQHRGCLSEFWKTLSEISWIKSVCTKPLCEFGFPLAEAGARS